MNRLRQILKLWKEERGKKSTLLHRRLFAFFACMAIFLIAVFSGVLLLFNIDGNGVESLKKFMGSELTYIQEAVSEDFSRLSVQGITFAEAVTANIELFLSANGVSADDLQSYPELIGPILAQQANTMIALFDNIQCSGMFIVLDATVNPGNVDAEYARSGLFLKKTFPNASQSVASKVFCLRGPAHIARENGLELLGQWHMEFDSRTEDFFTFPIETARANKDLPISRLFYWTERICLEDNSETAFLLCVPLRTSDGTVMGLCGFEVSDRMFKIQYSPKNQTYPYAFMTLSPLDGTNMCLERGMFAGSYYLTSVKVEQPLVINLENEYFYSYKSNENTFGGIHIELKLYPSGSPYSDSKWAVSVMMPGKIFQEELSGNNRYLLAIIILLIVVSLVASIIISKRYLRPVTDAFDRIKSGEYAEAPGTPYVEINDLMEYLAQQEEKNIQVAGDAQPVNVTPMFEEFLKNIETLSRAERNVFALYIKGYKAQEIADELKLSINTIKTHNRRIFAKLNVTTRKELLVYIDMMKEMSILNEGEWEVDVYD